MAVIYGKPVATAVTFDGMPIGTYDLNLELNDLNAMVNDVITRHLTDAFYDSNELKAPVTQGVVLPTPPPYRGGTTRLFVLAEKEPIPVYVGLLEADRQSWEKWMSFAYDRIRLKTTLLLGYRVFTLFNGCDPYQIRDHETNFVPREQLNLFKVVIQHGTEATKEFWFPTAADALDFHERTVRILNG